MRYFSFWAMLLAGVAHASTPTGRQIGQWRISSINTLSGASGDDAAALLIQDQGGATVKISWTQTDGDVVLVSVEVKSCIDDQDFGARYIVPARRWVDAGGRAMGRRVAADLVTCKAQTRLACQAGRDLSNLHAEKIVPAVIEFTQRLAYLRGYP